MSKSLHVVRRLAVMLCLWVVISPVTASAEEGGAGDLLISATRLVFQDSRHNADIILKNISSANTTYRVLLIDERMTKDGALERITAPTSADFVADKLIRYSPRQVVLPAGTSQTIRIQVKDAPGLAPGEYRSHMMFQGLPKNVGTSINQVKGEAKPSLRIQMTPVYGIAIPLIVRVGKTAANVKLTNLQYQAGDPKDNNASVHATIERIGNRSVFGDLLVSIRGKDHKAQVIGEMRGVAVYTSTDRREVNIPVELPATFKSGRIAIVYQDGENAGKLLTSDSFEFHAP